MKTLKFEAVTLGTLLAIAGCATGPVEPSADVAATHAPVVADATSEAKTGDDLRCEYRPVLGSRVGKRLCYTEEEWALMEKRADDTMKYFDEQTRRTPYEEGDG